MSEDSEDIAFAVEELLSVGRAREALPLVSRENKVKVPSDLLVRVLQEAAYQPVDGEPDTNDIMMFQHYVGEALQILDERGDVSATTLAGLEWKYLSLLEHSPRSAKVLRKAMSEEPTIFVQMLRAGFRPSEESGIIDDEPISSDRTEKIATQAYRLLSLWADIPGTREDGTINTGALEAWIKEARSQAKKIGREEIADSRIGTMLSASPMGKDGNWPAEEIREVIDLFRSKSMINGFWIGKSNRRGVTTRAPRDGGQQERDEAANYRKWSKAIAFEHPHTARVLENLAEYYEKEAVDHDEDAARLDWKD